MEKIEGVQENLISKLEDMKVLEMGPEDILILKLPNTLTTDEITCICDQVKELQKGPLVNREVLLFEGEIQIGLLRPVKSKSYDGDTDNGE